eukprot:Colp12_sorted_trinity150504_noHs@10216
MAKEQEHSAFVNFVSGTTAGFAQTVVGHPLDLLKVRLQAQETGGKIFKGPFDCLRRTIAEEGVFALYKGVSSPLISSVVFNSILFGAFEEYKKAFTPANGQISVAGFVAAAVCTGITESVFYCPMEILKLRLQTQYHKVGTAHVGLLGVVKQIYQSKGLAGFFHGLWPTIFREAPGNVIYFGTYGAFKELYRYRPHATEAEKVIVSGGLAGVIYWITQFPIDAVKTRLQTDSLSNPRYKGTLDCLRVTLREEGLRGLFRGLSPCLVRAFPANAAAFAAFEATRNFLTNADDSV